jgi:molecular chaperone HscB
MQGIDYFRLLSLPRDYSVDMKLAEDNYRDMQRHVHPDKVDDSTAANIPEGFSSLLNKAIKVIKSPTERAMHLLYLLDGCTIGEADLTNDPELLIEMMEINEEVEDCGRDKDCLEKQNVANKQRFEECDVQLKNLFANRQFAHARAVCERMHYLERVNDTILQKLNSV